MTKTIFKISLYIFILLSIFSCNREKTIAEKVEIHFWSTFVPANYGSSSVELISFSQTDTLFFPNKQLDKLNEIVWNYTQKHYNVLTEKVALVNSLSSHINTQEALEIASNHYEKEISYINFVLSQTYFKIDSVNSVSPSEIAFLTYLFIYTVNLDTINLQIGYSPSEEIFSHIFL